MLLFDFFPCDYQSHFPFTSHVSNFELYYRNWEKQSRKQTNTQKIPECSDEIFFHQGLLPSSGRQTVGIELGVRLGFNFE